MSTCLRTARQHVYGRHDEKGVAHSGWGQGVCIGDDNDGYEDLFVTYFGKNVLYHNNGSVTDISENQVSRAN